MVNPGAVNSPSMWGIAAAYHAMCCPKVTSKSKSVVQPRGECNSLPCNGLGRATILESALAIYVEGEWVVYRKGGHHQVMVKCGKNMVGLHSLPFGCHPLQQRHPTLQRSHAQMLKFGSHIGYCCCSHNGYFRFDVAGYTFTIKENARTTILDHM